MSSRHKPALSIIIPALNEAHSIGATLDAVSQLSGRIEVIVVDGGSDDDTREIASLRGAKIIASECGRGVQMHRGACARKVACCGSCTRTRLCPPTPWSASLKR